MTAQIPTVEPAAVARARSALAKIWRQYLNPSRPGAGRETLSGRVIHVLLFLATLMSAAVTVGIIAVLVFETIAFFREIPLRDFFGDTVWSPLIAVFNEDTGELENRFGIWALVWGTVLVGVLALAVAIPLGLLTAIFLSEYAPPKLRAVLKPVLEILAGVPTVVYGYFALLFITPIIRDIFPGTTIFNALSAGIVMGVMIIPMISSLSEDALSAVPNSLREGSYAMGATRMETALRVVLPAALSGVIASVILATSRAIGETLIVTVAAGQNPDFLASPLEAIQTMTAFIVQISLGDTPAGTIEAKTLFAVAMMLFLMTLGMNLVAASISRRFREQYE
jgi:phosphate transport system permease protein